ncbi:hypothetical protein M8C21_008085, partial [Ambrosia artemisiifolia]
VDNPDVDIFVSETGWPLILVDPFTMMQRSINGGNNGERELFPQQRVQAICMMEQDSSTYRVTICIHFSWYLDSLFVPEKLLLGFVTFLFPGGKSETRARLAPWHVFFGLVIFAMAIVTAETGITEKFIFQKLKHGQEALVVNFIGLLILVFGMFVGLVVVLPIRRK